MKDYHKIFIIFAAVIIVTAMSACGKKSDMELSLSEDVKAESVAASGVMESEFSQNSGSQESSGANPRTISNETVAEVNDGPIFVHICGAVRAPDVYEVPRDARVIDLIKLAGGFTDEADSDYHNLAGGLADGQKIYVPTEQEVADGLVPAPELNTVFESQAGDSEVQGDKGASEASDKVNINTATAEDLKKLNGIGDKRAQDIIDYRTSNGNFKTIEDIKKVNGIKDGIYAKICDDITVQ